MYSTLNLQGCSGPQLPVCRHTCPRLSHHLFPRSIVHYTETTVPFVHWPSSASLQLTSRGSPAAHWPGARCWKVLQRRRMTRGGAVTENREFSRVHLRTLRGLSAARARPVGRFGHAGGGCALRQRQSPRATAARTRRGGRAVSPPVSPPHLRAGGADAGGRRDKAPARVAACARLATGRGARGGPETAARSREMARMRGGNTEASSYTSPADFKPRASVNTTMHARTLTTEP